MSVVLTIGRDFIVNTTTWQEQRYPQVAALPGGLVAVSWSSGEPDLSDTYAGRVIVIDSRGAPVNPDVLLFDADVMPSAINSTNTTIGAFGDGSLLVCWQMRGDADGFGVFGSFLSASGVLTDGIFQINTTESGDQYINQWDRGGTYELADGRVLVTWESGDERGGLRGRIINADMTATDRDFRIVGWEELFGGVSATVGLREGGFLTVFHKGNNETFDTDLYGKFFSDRGKQVGKAFLVNEFSEGYQSDPELDVFDDGRILVSWLDLTGFFYIPTFRIINPDGSFATGNVTAPSTNLTALPSGNIMALKVENLNLYAYFLRADGTQIGAPLLVNNWTENIWGMDNAYHPTATVLDDGRIFVAWGTSGEGGTSDGSSAAIRGRYLSEYVELIGTDQRDRLIGGNAAEAIYGGDGKDLLVGSDGSDQLFGGRGQDVMAGGDGDDVYYVSISTDRLKEGIGKGFDLVQSDADFVLPDNVEALELLGEKGLSGTGNDLANRITGNLKNNLLSGMAGNDTIRGELGNDTVYGGAGDDNLTGWFGRDLVYGGDGNDLIDEDQFDRWNRADDTLYGEAGNDTIHAGNGLDIVFGGDGDDVMSDSTNKDTLTGGAGADVFSFDHIDISENDFFYLGVSIIKDFSRDEGDIIDVSKVDAVFRSYSDDAFIFRGTRAFTGTAGELRFADGTLQGDVNGDGLVDFRVVLEGVTEFRGSSLIL